MSTPTALDKLRKKYFATGMLYETDFDEAKQMEREQIIEGYCNGCADIIKDENIFPRETSEQYYNEIYGGQDE